MILVKIGLSVILGAALLVISFAVWRMLSSETDSWWMSPDEGYRWLTEDMGLAHDEAIEIVDHPSRG